MLAVGQRVRRPGRLAALPRLATVAALSMAYRPSQRPLVVNPTGQHTATVVWLHGLGDSGAGWEGVASSPPLDALRAKGLRFVFPSAARLPVTLNGGMLMPAWFDLTSLSDIDADEDDDGLAQSAAYVQSLLDAELAAGVPRARLFVAGFSQGGAVALAVALRQAEPLGGVLALSTWLAGRAAFPASLGAGARATPVFWAHGTHDGVVKTEYGQRSAAALRAMGLEVAWHTYPMAHSACPEEMQDAHDWLTSRL